MFLIEKAEKIEEIIAGEDDITEPACMEKVLMYLEEMQIEDDMFMQLLLDKLHDAYVYWDQPWYQIPKSLTRTAPTRVSEDQTLDMYRTDAISTDEIEVIKKNWRKFIKKYDLPDSIICFARWKNKNKSKNPRQSIDERVRQYVTAFLAQNLERSLYQVFRFVVSYFGAPIKGAYSPAEEKVMEICFHHNPKNAVRMMCLVLGREPRGMYKRLQQLFDGKPEQKQIRKWTLPLATKLVKLLLRYNECSLEDLKNKRIDKLVWLKAEKEMDIHFTYLQNFWIRYLHTQLFVKCDVKLTRLRKKIFKKLRLYPYRVWGDIRWKEMRKHFPDGFTYNFLYNVCYFVVKAIPDYRRITLDVLIEKCLKSIKPSRRRLKTLVFKAGNLEIVKYDVKLQTY